MENSPLIFGMESTSDTYLNDGFQVYDDEYSSGYDSTDFSDLESRGSVEESYDSLYGSRGSLEGSCGSLKTSDSKVNLMPPLNTEEFMNYRSTTTLCDNLRLILAMPDLCDVTFIVGPRKIPVHGVRAVLGTRSRVFYQLILKHTSMKTAEEEKVKKTKKKSKKDKVKASMGHDNKLVIPVTKYDSEVFSMLIEFVHCGKVNITEDTVAGLFCAAHHFQLEDLSKACLDFVEHCLKIGNAKTILFSTRCYSQHSASKYLFDKIYSLLEGRYIKMLEETAV
ncbi:hypothetical protein ACF0H5_018077 [Mactra antiquata]